MSKPSHRVGREESKAQRRERKVAQKALREQSRAQGLVAAPRAQISNGTCPHESPEEERAAREDATIEQVRVFRQQLSTLLKQLANIPDPRNPKRIKHKLTVLLVYGMLTFAFHMASRREANRTLTRPKFMENLKLLFPELESIPHHDTLYRLLRDIDVNGIEAAHLGLIHRLIDKKKFLKFLVANCYPIAIDGSQKLVRDFEWSEEALERHVMRGTVTALQHYAYVLEANLAFHNGMTIPLMSEFLSRADGDIETDKQDCEQKAFHRLAERLKKEFPQLRIMMLLDGLYPNGPVLATLREHNWDYMIVLQDKTLPSVWEEVNGLRKLQAENQLDRIRKDREQHFWWVNDIDYTYGPNGQHHHKVHVVVCEETWKEIVKDSSEVVTRTSRHAWISYRRLTAANVHERCNLGARHRWSGIEASFLVEKRCGYQYEHCFAYDWNAMKGYHFLMRTAHLLNVLAQHASALVDFVRGLGVRGLIEFVVTTIAGPWLDPVTARQRLAAPLLLRI